MTLRYVGAALLASSVVLVWMSAWLKGRSGLVATLGTMAAALIMLELSSTPSPAITSAFTATGMLLFYLFFAYVITGKYLTQTTAADLTYQSHSALVAFLDEQQDLSPLARSMRTAGPSLLVFGLIYGLLAAWAKYSGLLE